MEAIQQTGQGDDPWSLAVGGAGENKIIKQNPQQPPHRSDKASPLFFLHPGSVPSPWALKILPEVELQGVLGGSVVIECPLQGDTQVRMYLCRQMANPKTCTTVVSSYFVKEGYKHRVTLMPCSDRNLFLVELMGLTESDSGVYACGLGRSTDQGKTLKVTLSVHNDAAAQRTEAPLALRSTALVPTAHRSQTPRASSAAASMPPTPLPSREASKTSVQEGVLGPQEASYKHHTWLHGQRASSSGSAAGREDLGFHILIPSALGLLLLALLGLVLRRAVQRRRGGCSGAQEEMPLPLGEEHPRNISTLMGRLAY
ncbi:Fas apoptotic inhibitory molecule 3 [Fukomys damarensis]|uniref:Fas apoptotic inhibitory molecule 3 n=1 Tax=Fukomys damarensis TaxID=885580 RepID=A0A091CPT5_FUKDA|nr:Fas apoptotic inhibitory molecule 3 [Fukomys damarensis]